MPSKFLKKCIPIKKKLKSSNQLEAQTEKEDFFFISHSGEPKQSSSSSNKALTGRTMPQVSQQSERFKTLLVLFSVGGLLF